MGAVPPPVALTLPNAAGYSTMAKEMERRKEEEYAALMSSGGRSTSPKSGPRKKNIYDDEYLEKDSDDEPAYQPAPNSPGGAKGGAGEDDEDEEDPLDAFMAGVDKQAREDKVASEKKDKERSAQVDSGIETDEDKKKGLGRADIDDEDMQESYFKFLEERKANAPEEEEIYEYDEDGNIIWTWKKVIDPLAPIDHSTISYAPFNKDFYHEHEQIKAMSAIKVFEVRNRLNLKVAGFNPPKPVLSFAHFGFDESLMNVIRKSEYEHPTAIQAQSVPAALSGRDVLGIAKTGSGKTVAYLWPAIVHIMDQPQLKEGDGPIALIVVPTRELAIQASHNVSEVYQEAKRFCKVYNIAVVCAYGGGSKWEQQNALKEGAELVVATPGRIIDLVKIEATNFTRVTFLVFDEADRMFDMGFEAQVKSISNHIRPDRQCLMFSATFKAKVERLAREALLDPVRIVQGEVGEANEDVVQSVEVLPSVDAKWRWLLQRLVQFLAQGKVLIFVTRKQNAEEVAQRLRTKDFSLVLLHGDMLQVERNEKLHAFRKEIALMVATDVAARGLDIPEIRTVINFDLARDIDTHVHRIGRTGRAGEKGYAYTLVTEADKEMAGHLVRNLESVNQQVPDALLQLALKSAWFKNTRSGGQLGGQQGPRRLGLGYKPRTRPGLGAESKGKVLIFVTRKQNAEEVAQRLRTKDFSLVLLHGDMLQVERNEKLHAFRKEIALMVATDVAARGLDIPEIRTVINFDLARDIDTHVHRIGRTGRAGEKGYAYTLVTEADKEMAGHLVRNLESVNQQVPDALLQLALKSAWFKNTRSGGQLGGQQGPRRLGLGYKPRTRPGLGAESSGASSKETAKALACEGRSELKKRDPLDVAKAADGSTNRLQAVKAAFKSSFSNSFKASSNDEWAASRAAPTDPRPEWKRKLEEAAAAVNNEIARSASPNTQTGEHRQWETQGPTFGSKKRSRWQ
ncbi:ATP-dependent RNA helicase DDX42 [Toxocara canis]|uniref:RNA helicase n=1 Tax=Toxocara canis TaxID=6265 RepID=A0A0B2W3T2_TOXCA|nr:ATP-dependent RNA helicase DDX42 [Toxocara canis]